MARNGGRAAVIAVDHQRGRKTQARPVRHSTPAPKHCGGLAGPAIAAVKTTPVFNERSLFAEGLTAAFRIDAGGGWATGSLPSGSGENEIAKFLSEAMSLAKQMQAAMGGADAAAVEILIADPEAGPSRQSAIKVAVEKTGGTVVTPQSGGGAHRVAMLQHFLMALN